MAVRPFSLSIGLAAWLAWLGSAAGAAPGGPTAFDAGRRAFQDTCRAFSAYDRDHDGSPEIASLRPCDCARGRGRGVVVVLVESRLVRAEAQPTGQQPTSLPDLHPALRTYMRDLGHEGWNAYMAEAALYAGTTHEDGLIVLALRDFLQAVRRRVPDLASVVLVGNFPTAFLVRQYYWPRDDGLTLYGGTKAEQRWDAVRHVRSVAEVVASPCDLVLADLDGHWDQCYLREPQRVGGLLAAFPDDPDRRVTGLYQYTAERYEDFFLVQDGCWDERPAPGGRKEFVFRGEPNSECTDQDRKQADVLARPEISVGRINAIHAGVDVNPAIRGAHGEGLLDAQGRPRAVEIAADQPVPGVTEYWVRAERMERRLLVEYFGRNHRYRTGGYREGLEPASISTEWDSSVPEMKACVAGWKDVPAAGLDVHGSGVTVADFVRWMERPALARAVKAHSGSWGSYFAGPPDLAAYERSAGAQTWWWTREGHRLVPSLKGAGGAVDYAVLRTLYENHAMPDVPALYFHTGCEIMMPQFFEAEPYNSPRHGMLQAGEAFLMLGNGLAFVGRGKVFYDEPREFWKVLGAGGTWGDAWRHYFDVEGADAALAKDGIGRKRAYFWSTLGDCTLTLPLTLTMPARAGKGARP